MNNIDLFDKEYYNNTLDNVQKKFIGDISPFISSISMEQLKLLNNYHKFINSNYLLKNPQYHSEFRNTYNPMYNNNNNNIKQNIGIEHEEIKNDLLNKVNADPRYKFYNSKEDYDFSTNTYNNRSIQDFIPSNTYIGSIKGYVFQNDFKGIGYYLDNKKTF